MSRVGRQLIIIPSGVDVSISGADIKVTGPKGELSMTTLPGISVKQDDETISVSRSSDELTQKARHGLIRSLLNNMLVGVSEGFSKKLEINGVGYRVNLAGSELKFNLGYSHEVVYKLPESVTAVVDQNTITISGVSKQQVGQVAAEIRALKKPEPYKGKGIKYDNERILRKSGKSGKEKAA